MNKPSIRIHYCTGCKWLTRSSWMAQELLETFSDDLASVSLCPSDQSGTFKIMVSDSPADNGSETLVWDRTVDQGFPQIKALKKRVRDIITPARELGHLDR